MAMNVDTKVTPALHPINVKKIDGYDEETAPVLAATEKAFAAAYEGVRDVFKAREFAARNPAWTEGQQILHTDTLARKHLDKITRQFDRVRDDLTRGIVHLEGELSSPVSTKASLQIAAEIRNHCKSLAGGAARMDFVRNLINDGDDLSASAILGGPAFLSGLDKEQVALFTRQYHEKQQPALSKRLKAMRGAVRLIERNAALVFGQLDEAVGCPPGKVKALREANTAAERAMVMRDVA